MNLNLQNKKGMTLIEIIIVVGIILGLLAWLATSLSWVASKQKDSWRVKLMQEYMTYYDAVKQSIWQYPWASVKGTWTVKDLARALAVWEVKYTFDEVKADWFYNDANLEKLQKLLIATWDLWDAGSIKQWFQDEALIIFTSTSQKRTVGCMKLYAPTEAAQNDWDWIPDTNAADGADAHKNGNRIFVTGDMWLWKQNQAAYTTACQWLPDPKSL